MYQPWILHIVKCTVQILEKSIKNWASNCSSKIWLQNSAKCGMAKSCAKENKRPLHSLIMILPALKPQWRTWALKSACWWAVEVNAIQSESAKDVLASMAPAMAHKLPWRIETCQSPINNILYCLSTVSFNQQLLVSQCMCKGGVIPLFHPHPFPNVPSHQEPQVPIVEWLVWMVRTA